MRDRLIELLDKAFIESDDNYGRPNTDQVADYLIANNVIVLDAAVPVDNDNVGEGEGEQ